jgi:hypothetical protein
MVRFCQDKSLDTYDVICDYDLIKQYDKLASGCMQFNENLI